MSYDVDAVMQEDYWRTVSNDAEEAMLGIGKVIGELTFEMAELPDLAVKLLAWGSTLHVTFRLPKPDPKTLAYVKGTGVSGDAKINNTILTYYQAAGSQIIAAITEELLGAAARGLPYERTVYSGRNVAAAVAALVHAVSPAMYLVTFNLPQFCRRLVMDRPETGRSTTERIHLNWQAEWNPTIKYQRSAQFLGIPCLEYKRNETAVNPGWFKHLLFNLSRARR